MTSGRRLAFVLFAMWAMAGPSPSTLVAATDAANRLADGTRKIEHVVVLMLENRSFDHMLGWLKKDPAFRALNGLTGDESNPVNCSDPRSPLVKVTEHADYEPADLGHEVSDITEQLTCDRLTDFSKTYTAAQFKMNGFVTNTHHTHVPIPNQQQTMQAFPEKEVPVIYSLARQAGIVDTYHCSVPGNTQNNRLFFHCGSVSGLCVNFDKNKVLAGLPDATIYNRLVEHGLTFRIYQHDLSSTIYFKQMRRWKLLQNYRLFPSFMNDARTGDLPNFSFIEPRYFDLLGFPANDQHPSHPVPYGEQLMKHVYEALRASPKWEKTALIITYDEHGGFFDHVPPAAEVPNSEAGHGRGPCPAGGESPKNWAFNRGGLRVPFLILSPWVDKGILRNFNRPTATSVLEHTSMWPTLRKLFGIPANKDTDLSNRTPWAATFENVFSRSSPRKDFPSTVASPAAVKVNTHNFMNGLQEEFLNAMAVLAGVPPPKGMTETAAGEFIVKTMTFLGKVIEKYDSLEDKVISAANKVKTGVATAATNVKQGLTNLWEESKKKAATVASWFRWKEQAAHLQPKGDLGADLRFESTMSDAELKSLANAPMRAANGELQGPDGMHPLFDADTYLNSGPYFMPGILSELAAAHGLPDHAFKVFADP